jgi:hypothetical protein
MKQGYSSAAGAVDDEPPRTQPHQPDPDPDLLVFWLRCRHEPALVDSLRTRLQTPPYAWHGHTWDESAWQHLLERAEAERLAGLLYTVARHRDLCPPPVEKRLHDAFLHTAIRNRLALQQLSGALAGLAAARVSVVVLKGAALLATVYESTGVRPMVDLDLLVRREQVPAAVAALAPAGYTVTGSQPHADTTLAYENELVLTGGTPGFTFLELHWSLFDSPHHQHALDLDWFWRSAQPAALEAHTIQVLSPAAQLLHLCGHLALHHRHHAQLLWQNDIAELLVRCRAELAWDEVLAQAQRGDLVLSLRYALGEVVARWQAPVPPPVQAELAALNPSPAERRVYGWLTAEQRPTVQRFWADLAGLPGWRQRLDYGWRNLFPASAYMVRRYGIRRPWLVPLYYPYRWGMGAAQWLAARRAR